MKKALVTASVASMIDQFNKENIRILQELGYEVTIACNFKQGNTTSEERLRAFRKEMKENDVKMLHVPIPRYVTKGKDFFLSFQILRKNMAKEGYELMHCQSPIGGVVARLAAKPFRKEGMVGNRNPRMKVIYYAHGFHFFTGAGLMNWLAYYNIERYCSRFTDCQITLNREDYLRAKRRLKAKKVVYMPGVGIDLKQFDVAIDKEEKCRELSLPAGKKIVLSVGELSDRKNVMVTLEAFAKANPKDAILVFCGLGPKKDELDAKIADYRIKDKVYFLGYRMDVPEVCKISDIFLFPSKQEGLPAALMQAMAAGLPVLCSDIRGNKDLVEDKKGGYLYTPFDVAGYADGIVGLLANGKLAMEMGIYNRKKVKKYDIKRVNHLMKQLYISV